LKNRNKQSLLQREQIAILYSAAYSLLIAKTIPALHLLTLWPWHLTFWPQIKRVTMQKLSCTIHLPSLVMICPVVFVLECCQHRWHTYTHIHRAAKRLLTPATTSAWRPVSTTAALRCAAR